MSQFKYEIIYILDPNTATEDIQIVGAKVEQIVADAKGTVLKKEEWGRRRLAYRVKRQREGFYVFFQIAVDTKTIEEITRNLRLLEKVIKFQVVKEEISLRKPKPPRKKNPRPPGEGMNRSSGSRPYTSRPPMSSSSTPSASVAPTAVVAAAAPSAPVVPVAPVAPTAPVESAPATETTAS